MQRPEAGTRLAFLKSRNLKSGESILCFKPFSHKLFVFPVLARNGEFGLWQEGPEIQVT